MTKKTNFLGCSRSHAKIGGWYDCNLREQYDLQEYVSSANLISFLNLERLGRPSVTFQLSRGKDYYLFKRCEYFPSHQQFLIW